MKVLFKFLAFGVGSEPTWRLISFCLFINHGEHSADQNILWVIWNDILGNRNQMIYDRLSHDLPWKTRSIKPCEKTGNMSTSRVSKVSSTMSSVMDYSTISIHCCISDWNVMHACHIIKYIGSHIFNFFLFHLKPSSEWTIFFDEFIISSPRLKPIHNVAN